MQRTRLGNFCRSLPGGGCMELMERIEQQMAATQLAAVRDHTGRGPLSRHTADSHSALARIRTRAAGRSRERASRCLQACPELGAAAQRALGRCAHRRSRSSGSGLGAGRLGRGARRAPFVAPSRAPSRVKRSSVCRLSARFPSAWTAIKSSWRMRRMPTSCFDVAARRGYLMWMFRPVRGGIWKDVRRRRHLEAGRHARAALSGRAGPPAGSGRTRKTVYRFGVSASLRTLSRPH